ncbi:MAG: pyrophosphate phosphatase [Verrucomicrobiaceae bacterium]|nr:pyrophosphate phosphatase [Verrucomicrobiaceae bacterium]
MSDLWHVVLLGIIEGITEFLPISSTGHLLIAEKLGLGQRSDVFNIVIQAGAILAVTIIYWSRIWQLAINIKKPENLDYALKLGVSFLITAVLGLIVTKLGFKLPEAITPVAWALIIGGIWMVVAEYFAERKPDSAKITWKVAIAVGLAQIVAAIFPGTSRSAATIFIAMLVGTGNRAAATEFAFLVGIPTMYAASAKVVFDLSRHGGFGDENWSALGIAFVVSTVTAFVAVKWLLRYIQTHRFTVFAVYRVIVGAALLLLLPAGT